MKGGDFPVLVKEQVVAQRTYSKRVTELRLKCGHVLYAINPVADSHPCYFCSYPRDKGLKKLERHWVPINLGY